MLILYNNDNGEIIREIEKSELLDLTKQATQEYLDNTNKIFMPSFSKIDNRLFTDVKTSNLKLFVFFISLVNNSDGILRYKNRKVTASELMKVSGSYSRGYYKFINELLEQDVIKKIKDGTKCYYCFNPYLCCRGKRVKGELYELFKESEWNRSVKDKRHCIKRIEKAKDDASRIDKEN